MRVRILGEGFYANVYARNMAYFGHEVVEETPDIFVIAYDALTYGWNSLFEPAIVVTPLTFNQARTLPDNVAYVPENLRRTNPDASLRTQRAVVVGRNGTQYDRVYGEFLSEIYYHLYWGTPLEAALYKHMLSSYLAAMLTLGNEWKAAADALGIEHTASAWACLKEEPRISRHAPITPGPFDGSHFLRDLKDFPASLDTLLLNGLADTDELGSDWVMK